MNAAPAVVALRSAFQTDTWLQDEYSELLAALERTTGQAVCVYGRDSSADARSRVLAALEASSSTFLVATGGVEGVFADLLPHIRCPCIELVADGRNNSLAAALEILAYLTSRGRKGRIIHAPTAQDMAQQLLAPACEVAEAAKEAAQKTEAAKDTLLDGCKVGCVGAPSDWLIASGVDRAVLAARYGVELVDVPMPELIARYESVPAAQAEELADKYLAAVALVSEPARDDVVRSMRVYVALRGLCAERGLCALTVRCFDIVHALRATACVALSMLNDEGIVAGCEGDLQALLSMLLARRLLGAPAFMANPSGLSADETVLAHCTVPAAMCSSVALRSHFESGLGVAPQGTLPAGPDQWYTLFRWGGAALDRAFVAEAAAVARAPEQHDEHLCRTQIALALDTRAYLLAQPIGNHHVLVAGRHAAKLIDFMRRNNVALV